MADEQIVTNIVATSDFSSLIADVQRTTSALSKLQQELSLSNKALANQAGQIQKAFGETLRSTGQFTSHFVTVGSEVENFGKNLDSGKLKLRDYYRTWQTHAKTSGGLIRDLAKQQTALQNAIVQPLGRTADGLMKFNVHVANGLNEVANKSMIAKKEMQIFNKVIQDGGVQLINWGKNTQWAGRQLTVGLTVPMAAFGAAAAKAFKEADQELVRLTKVYGGIAATSSADLAKIRQDVSQTAKELAAAYGTSYKDTISLAADIAATGKQGNELLQSTKEATRLSVLGEVDRQEAMRATLAIQTAFKQNTTELSESINFLNAVENQTSTSLADLVEAIPKAGPVVKALGGDVQDLALYLTAMREGGINASEGANALKSALASIINPTKVAKELFTSFGIDLGGIVTKNAGDLTGTILEIQKALETLDPLKKSQAIEQLFGKFQFARMNALFENLGKQGSQTLQVLDLMKASSEDLANIAGRELGQITESASGKYKRAIESLRAELATLGEQFLQIGTFFINTIDGIVKFINKLPGPIKTALGLLGGFTALVGPLIMLTGVFANFFGYAIKGVGHLRALFKGGEGFKLLTPQIIAAEQAGSLMEKTFYSDAQAAAVLQAALKNLTNELSILEQKASAGTISAQPLISTIAGTVAMQGGAERVVNKNSPFLGKAYSREMSHMIPSKTGQPETMFGVVPGTGPINKRISNNPQIYMEGDLPKIPGLTSIGGVSTGVVAGEAAKWHSMTAAIAMQSQEEIAALKAEVAATGTITASLSDSYQALLPAMNTLTKNAAADAAVIVADLQASKITVDQARARIIELNAQVEAAMAATATEIAGLQGRNINVSGVPLTNQPAVNPATKKSNMKEMFHKTANRTLINRIAGALGVRTSGGGYSVETTIPKRFNMGNIVPGTGNTDTVPAMLTPGEFVVNAKSTAANLPLLQAINGNRGSNGPAYNLGSAQEIRASHQGRQLAHLDDPISMSSLSVDNSMRTQAMFGLSSAQMSTPGAGTRSAFHASYHKFFNQMSKNGTLKISDAINYLNGSPVFDPYAKSNVIHDPGFAYKTMMMDLGIPTEQQAKFAADIDREIVNELIKQEKAGIQYLSDTPRNTSQARASIVGSSIEKFIKTKTNPEIIRNLAVLKQPQEARIPHGGRSGSQRFFRINESRVSGAVAAIVAKRKMPGLFGLAAQALPMLASRFTKRPILNPRYVEPSEHALKLNRKWGRGYNAGGLVQNYNDGGQVPLSAGYMANFRQSRAGISNAGSRLAGSMGSMPAQMGMSMAAYGVGSSIGGNVGNAISIGGSVLPMVLPSLIKGLTGLGPGVSIVAKLAGLLGRLTIPGALIGGLFTVVKLFQHFHSEAEKTGKLNRTMFGGTDKTLGEVGLRYKTIADRIKDVNEQLELNRAKARSAFESRTSSGVGGLNLTIAELKQGIKSARKDAPETVGMFDKASSSQAVELATSLKAQYVSLGMSAQEATNKIYTIISASKNSGAALAAITSKPFVEITDAATASAQSVKKLGDSLKKNMNAEELAVGIDAVLNNLSAYQESLVGTKDKMGNIITPAKALEMTMENIKKTQGGTTPILAANLEKIKQQNPALKAVLGTSESIASVYAKTQLALAGLADKMNLAAMSASQAILVAQGYEQIKSSAADVIGNTPIGDVIKAADKAAKNAKSASASSAMDAKTIDKAIKLKQELIDKLEEERKLRLKILDVQQQSEDFATSLQQAQIRYQEALAAGDMAQAAQEQLNIKKLSADRERELARAAINDKADAERKKLEDEIKKLQEQKDAKASAASGAASSASKRAEDASEANTLKSTLVDIISKNIAKGTSGTEEIGAAIDAAIDAGGATGKAAQKLKNKYKTGGVTLSPQGIPRATQDPYTALINDLKMQTEVSAKSDTKFSKAVDAFVTAVDTFTGNKKQPSSPATSMSNYGRPLPGIDYKKYPQKAFGGPFQSNTTMLVGEMGPELVKFGAGGMIIPNNKLNGPSYNIPTNNYSMRGNATMGGAPIQIVMNNHAAPGMDVNAFADIAAKKTIAVLNKLDRNKSATIGSTGRYIG